MWIYRGYKTGGPTVFFRLALCSESLANMMNTNFSMMQNHKYSLTELENMLPWEREVYVSLLMNHIAEENARIKAQQNK